METKINFIHGLMKKYHESNFNIHFAAAVKCPQGEKIHSNINLAWHKRQNIKYGLSQSKFSNFQHFSSMQGCIPEEEEIKGQGRKGFYSECQKRTLKVFGLLLVNKQTVTGTIRQRRNYF